MTEVDILFKTDKLELLFHDDAQLEKKWGPDMAQRIRRRLDDLRAVECLHDVRGIPGAVASAGGKSLGKFSLIVQHPHGLLFEVVDERPAKKRAGSLDWAKVTAVRVLGIGPPND
jgi:proteic killer suppression protein